MTTVLARPKDKTIPDGKFWADDVTGKLKQYAAFLTQAMEADNGSFVLCVDAPWGLGKTFFVERWAKALKEIEGKTVVEFNAWQSDSDEDPLVPFIAAVTEQLLDQIPDGNSVIQKVRQGAGRVALRTGGIMVRAGIRKALGDKGLAEINDLLDNDTEGEVE